MHLKNDPHIFELIAQERERQRTTIDLIASENYTSLAVREASASVLTNKYAEGYPGKRYYAGCEVVDQVELLAIDRCKKLFGAEYANVQPHAGSQANMAAYFTLLRPGDTIMGMSLSSGGHLTHGMHLNFSGTFYKVVSYTVDAETEQLNYDEIERLAKEHKPRLIIAGASAYPQLIDPARFAQIAQSVGAYFLFDMAHIAGLVAARLHPDPVVHADIVTSTTHKTLRGPRGAFILAKKQHGPAIDKAVMPGIQGGPFMNVIAAKAVAFAEAQTQAFIEYQKQIVLNAQELAEQFHARGYRLVSGGTKNHLFILDLRSKNITGRDAEMLLASVGITASRSTIPFDTASPIITSGIRFGTPAITTRGLKTEHMEMVAQFVDDAIAYRAESDRLQKITREVKAFISEFPEFN